MTDVAVVGVPKPGKWHTWDVGVSAQVGLVALAYEPESHRNFQNMISVCINRSPARCKNGALCELLHDGNAKNRSGSRK